MKVRVVSICDIVSKEQFRDWLRKLPVRYTPKREEAVIERAMLYKKCIWSRFPEEGIDPGLNFLK